MDRIAATYGETAGLVNAGPDFSYEEAFSRNLGWVTEWEHQILRRKRVAIAGMGGVGGVHLLTLARFGIGAFNIADGDSFELVNFNRQAGATLASIGQSKVRVMTQAAREINPELDIECFDKGITEANLDRFLAGVDICIDGLDFFVLDIRRKLNARCRELGIPVIIAAPLGMGASYLVFLPDGMSFETWFRFDGLSEQQQYVSFLLGLAPSALHGGYLADWSRVDLRRQRVPSTVAGCTLCAGVASVEAVKLALGRGPVRGVPYYHQFDAYRGRWVTRKLRGGNANPIQRVKINLMGRFAAKLSNQLVDPPPADKIATSDVATIIDVARWAPSPENTQPWRFELINNERVIVHVRFPSDVYAYRDGEPTLIAAGCLLETVKIAASAYRRGMSWRDLGRSGDTQRIAVDLPYKPDIVPDQLLGLIRARSVDRRRYRRIPLTERQRDALNATLGTEFTIRWHEGIAERWRAASLNSLATDIRLRIPETYEIHKRILDWEHDFSPNAIPGRAIGLDPLTRRLVRWAMRDRLRLDVLNRMLGTMLARLEMDLIPGVCCAAHFTISAANLPEGSENTSVLLAAGQAFQRFWLTAASLGLAVQPTLAPICFGHYGRNGKNFTVDRKRRAGAVGLADLLEREMGGTGGQIILRGRIGLPRDRAVVPRSTRQDLHELCLS